MPQSPVTPTLSDEDDGFMDLLDGDSLKVWCGYVLSDPFLLTFPREPSSEKEQ